VDINQGHANNRVVDYLFQVLYKRIEVRVDYKALIDQIPSSKDIGKFLSPFI